ncbi:CobW family GTP-binding protein [Halodurantibacterium flavum]|uniref:CobW family GTP-binding protein n=1 Tax=Halodurantibacterium flavum TaxID=1382802 RepID=A0ABW4RZN8_9RHOB
MADRAGRRLRLTVLGGYLGAGKTTWLRHLLHHSGARLHVIVNEAAGLPVDDGLLGRAAGVTVLAGGCACCEGRAALIAALRGLCDAWVAPDAARPDALILETSGLADPGAIVAAIRADPVLAHHLLLHEIVVMVDARHAPAQLRAEPLGRAQVAAADRLILSRVAGLDPLALAQVLADLRSLNPAVTPEAAEHGVPLPLPEPAAGVAVAPLPPLADEAGPVSAMQVTVDGADWAAFSLWLSALLHAWGDDLVRIKGVVPTPAGRLLIQTVRREVQPPEVLPPDQPGEAIASDRYEGQIVVLGRGCVAGDLQRSLDRFTRI